MNDRVRAIVAEARKLTPQERRELFDLLEVTFIGDTGDGTPERDRGRVAQRGRGAHCETRARPVEFRGL
jgi:hypothetical protein